MRVSVSEKERVTVELISNQIEFTDIHSSRD